MKQPDVTVLNAPLHPYLVLLIAIFLPGAGQVLNQTPMRGFTMLLFMLILGAVTYNLASPDVSIVGHLAGGLFIYALSIMDAYMWARYRWTVAQTRI